MNLQGVTTYFFFKYPLKAADFNEIFYRGFSPGVISGLEIRKTGAKEVSLYKGSAFILDKTPKNSMVKFNVDVEPVPSSINSLDLSADPAKTRIVAEYNFAENTTTSNTISVAAINPSDALDGRIVLADIVLDISDEVDWIDYSNRTYCNTSEELSMLRSPPCIGIREASLTDQIKPEYNSALNQNFTRYRMENLGNLSALFESDASTWNTPIAGTSHYYAFLVQETDQSISLKIYFVTDADYDTTLKKFKGVSKLFPFHIFIGEFYSDATPDVDPVSLIDSFLNCQRGDVKMFTAGLGAPLGFDLCDGLNNTPNLKHMFVAGFDSADTGYDALGNGNNTDGKVGESTHVLSEAELASHVHSAGGLSNTHSHYLFNDGGDINPGSDINNSEWVADEGGTGASNLDKYHTRKSSSIADKGLSGANIGGISGSTGSIGSDTAHENRPPYYVVYFALRK